MNTRPDLLTAEFRALSEKLGRDPLQVQGPGGNTSIKDGDVMWIKASGTELADATSNPIFVAVDRKAALAEAREEQGDGSCKSTVLDPAISLRPSIETTFHAALDHPVVAHTHSVATLVHVIGPQGRLAAEKKLSGLPFAMVPYAKPGLPLTREILARVTPETQIFLLQNHGLICCGASVAEVAYLIEEVERRLSMHARDVDADEPSIARPQGWEWSSQSWIARDDRALRIAKSGSYYPDHVVFLGPALPMSETEGAPAYLVEGEGILQLADATSSQIAMLRCLSDVLLRLPAEWQPEAIGTDAEASLLNWDAEKYRQALAEQK